MQYPYLVIETPEAAWVETREEFEAGEKPEKFVSHPCDTEDDAKELAKKIRDDD